MAKKIILSDQIIKFRDTYCSAFGWGEYEYANREEKSIRFANNKIVIEGALNKKTYQGWNKEGRKVQKKFFPKSIHKQKTRWLNHLNKTDRMYYTNRMSKENEIMIMIDIDIKKSNSRGSKRGAIRFANRLKEIFGKELYTEPSTSGNAIHGYIRINTEGVSHPELLSLLKKFELYLEQIRINEKHNIELVELKGHPYHYTYEKNQYKIINMGQLAKIPFALSCPKQSERLFNTTKINISAIRIGLFVPNEDKPVLSNETGSKAIPESKETKSKKTGSRQLSRINVGQKLLDRLPHYAKAGYSLFGDIGIDRWHIANAMLIMIFVKNNPIRDKDFGTLKETSTELFKTIWDYLYKHKKINKSFDYGVFCKIKNLLSSRGFIHWIDNTYCSGKATTWFISGELVELLHSGSNDWSEDHTHLNGLEQHKLSESMEVESIVV